MTNPQRISTPGWTADRVADTDPVRRTTLGGWGGWSTVRQREPPARRDDKRCGSEESGKPPFVREFLKLEDETAKLRHLRTWNPQTPEQVEQNCLSETHAFHFNSLIKLFLLHHAAEDEVDCAALADNLNEAFSSSSRAAPANWIMGTSYAAVYRMFDVVVEHICPGAPRVSCGGLGCPPDLRQGEPVPQGLLGRPRHRLGAPMRYAAVTKSVAQHRR